VFIADTTSNKKAVADSMSAPTRQPSAEVVTRSHKRRNQMLAKERDRVGTVDDRGRAELVGFGPPLAQRDLPLREGSFRQTGRNLGTSPACAARAFDPQLVQLAGDIAEGQIGPGHESVERLDP
jgi:hypothetical protein